MDKKERHFNTLDENENREAAYAADEHLPEKHSNREENESAEGPIDLPMEETEASVDTEAAEANGLNEPEKREESSESISYEKEEAPRSSRMQPERTKNKSGIKKTMLASFGAGILGTVLTLSIVPFTDYADWIAGTAGKEQPTAAVGKSEDLSTEGAVKIQETAVTASDIADMVEQASPAIVGVVNIQQQQQSGQGFYYPFEQQGQEESVESGIGSGVIFKVEGNTAYVVTNNHVIEGSDQIEIAFSSGEKTSAELVGTDALTDLAVLKMDAGYVEAVLEFGDSSVVRAGEEVIAIGNPLGLEYAGSVTQGIVSAVDRTVSVETSAGAWDLTTIQTDAAINPGNSGGALMNAQGQVIGINSLKISDDDVEGIGFAIPSNDAVPIINEIMETGQVNRPYLGVGLASLEEIPQYYLQSLPEEVEGGVVITSVQEGSAASNAGLQVQDVIVAVNGTEVGNSTDFRKNLYNLKPGDTAELTVFSSGKEKTVKVTLGGTAE